MARSVPPDSRQSVPEGAAVRLLDEIIGRAAAIGASDVHLEPKAEQLRVRFRIDGVMADQPTVGREMGVQLVARVKVLGRLDIAERRLPQDGTFKVQLAGREVSIRVSTFPTFEGEKAVMRLLIGGAVLPMDELGVDDVQADTLRHFCRQNGGLVLVTGPTGSGKTSTLYTLLSELETSRLNVVTLEDPIEVQLPDITQGQVHPKAGFTFASGLRAILRQDPDVILVGEMRDVETAGIALQASLTGHLVLSTLHTNSTIATITRLLDIGLEPYVVASALVGVVAQRLVRTVCPACSTMAPMNPRLAGEVGFELPPGGMLPQAVGCPQCHGTGYRGRRGLYEVVPITDRLSPLIKAKAEAGAYKQVLRAMQIPTLRRVGMRAAYAGVTTPDEVLRVT